MRKEPWAGEVPCLDFWGHLVRCKPKPPDQPVCRRVPTKGPSYTPEGTIVCETKQPDRWKEVAATIFGWLIFILFALFFLAFMGFNFGPR
jgi:hypothetical protein